MVSPELMDSLTKTVIQLNKMIETANDDLELSREIGNPLTDLEAKLASLTAKRDLIIQALEKRMPKQTPKPTKKVAAVTGQVGGT